MRISGARRTTGRGRAVRHAPAFDGIARVLAAAGILAEPPAAPANSGPGMGLGHRRGVVAPGPPDAPEHLPRTRGPLLGVLVPRKKPPPSWCSLLAETPDLGTRLQAPSKAALISHQEQASRIGTGRSTDAGASGRRLAEQYLRKIKELAPKPD
jgi:hypothetical protein